MAKWNGFGNRAERTTSFVHGLPCFCGGIAQPLKVAYHIVEPWLGTIEKPVPPGGEEKKSKAGTDGGPRQHFRQLRLLVHTNLLYDRRGTSARQTLALDDPPSLDQLYQQC